MYNVELEGLYRGLSPSQKLVGVQGGSAYSVINFFQKIFSKKNISKAGNGQRLFLYYIISLQYSFPNKMNRSQ
jgi:hypothetical protein